MLYRVSVSSLSLSVWLSVPAARQCVCVLIVCGLSGVNQACIVSERLNSVCEADSISIPAYSQSYQSLYFRVGVCESVAVVFLQ